MTAPYGPHSSLLQPHSESPLQPHTGAPFKGDLSVIGRQARYHNDQDSELSSLAPKSAPYECSEHVQNGQNIQPFRPTIQLFNPTFEPFSHLTIQPHLSKEITSLYSMTRYTKMLSSMTREKMHPLRPPEHS